MVFLNSTKSRVFLSVFVAFIFLTFFIPTANAYTTILNKTGGLFVRKLMRKGLIKEGVIPLDKSWIIRMGVLDLLRGYNNTIDFLEIHQDELGDDLKALLRALYSWNSKKPIDVGESGTLYRFLKFASWKLELNKTFVLHKTLKQRHICDKREIVNYPLKDLLKLDNRTSQWASASVLLGNEEKIDNPPFKLKLTYGAVSHWKMSREKGLCWKPRYDETILRQVEAFVELLKIGKTSFVPQQAEDYCFARVFGLITKEEGKNRWPSLCGHESDRIEEMELELQKANDGLDIDSKDHRVVQAIAMLFKLKNKPINFKYPQSVSKSWPQFWTFLNSEL
ncbi:MAG: hypothetical protein CVU81_01750 [Euryarchaeota archaeon HGW-Euryarchaeota-1]|nr:MAG: hypothetical protein CVU81_01750 [Euryarchaeota archaeon HGW-Euryarchaeota-1]